MPERSKGGVFVGNQEMGVGLMDICYSGVERW